MFTIVTLSSLWLHIQFKSLVSSTANHLGNILCVFRPGRSIQSRFKATESMVVWAEGKTSIFSGARTLVDLFHATHIQKCSSKHGWLQCDSSSLYKVLAASQQILVCWFGVWEDLISDN